MALMDRVYADALRVCDALSTSADSLANLEAPDESIREEYKKLAKHALRWSYRAFKLKECLDHHGYTVALQDIDEYAREFGKFVNYAREQIETRDGSIDFDTIRGFEDCNE